MSAPDAYRGEMPGFPHPGRPGGEHDEPLLDMIFDGRAVPPDAPQEMHDLQRMLAALAGPAEPGELAGEATARAALILLASPAGVSPEAPRPAAGTRPRRPASHRLRGRPARRRAGLAAALCAAAALAVSAAAYADVLPDPIQQVAHNTVGAPAPRHHGAPWPAGSGPRRDTRHRPGPSGPSASRPDRPAEAGRSPGYAHVARPRHEPSWDGPQPASSCQPGGQWAGQDPSGYPPGFPQPRGYRCSGDDAGRSADRGTMYPGRLG
jgi:hypothetical protein